jgi:hypothetical protein
MPSADLHLEQAKHNERLIGFLDVHTSPFLDWIVTIAFYAALHYVEAFFYNHAPVRHSDNHQHRVSLLRTYAPNVAVFKTYERMYNWSRLARYISPTASVQGKPVSSRFSRQDVETLISSDLPFIKQELGFQIP